MKKSIRIAIVLFLSLALWLPSAFAGDLTGGRLIFGTIQSPTTPETIAARFFAQLIEAETDGRFRVEVVPAAQLGPALEQYEHTMTGAQHFFLDALEWNGQFVKDYGVMAVPFGFRDVDHLLAFLDSPLAEELRNELSSRYGLVTLSDKLIRSPRVVHSVKEVMTPEDMERMAFRVPEIDVYFESWRAIGVSPTPVAWGEKYFALQQGIIEGGEGPFTTLYPMNFTEVSKYIIETNHLYSMNTMIMHKGTFDRLSEEDQIIFMNVAEMTAQFYSTQVLDLEEEHRTRMVEDHGVTFITPSSEILERFAARVEAAVADFEAKGLWSEGLYVQMRSIE